MAEAELAGGFQSAQIGTHHRLTLKDFGYPQPPTLLRMDNTVALGIAAGKVNGKRTKSIVMRFFWLSDRANQGHFYCSHIAGQYNIADFFTKALPRTKFYQYYPYLAINMDMENDDTNAAVDTTTTTVVIKQQ